MGTLLTETLGCIGFHTQHGGLGGGGGGGGG